MAITPEEAEKSRPSNTRKIKQLERIIDRLIKDNYSRGDCYSLNWDIPRGTDNRVISELVNIYREAGWLVNYESPERGEPYLSFLPKKPYEERSTGRPIETT